MKRVVSPIPAAVITAQRDAADPGASAWVEANAGSGKTHVLTQRVLRLLLAGVAPEQILCLTYTKAAAAEMRKRIAARLADWALLEPEKLRQSLLDITGAIATGTEQRRARTLFAHALDTPGGLKIETIHAFCESVLHRFPVEAGVPFDFTVLEDYQRQAMILRARETVLAGGLAGSGEAKAVETLFGAMSDFLITEAIDESFAKARPLRHILHDRDGAKANLRRLVGDTGETVEELRRRIETETLLLAGDCRELVRLLNGDSRKSRRFVDILARVNLDRPSCDDLLTAFVTGEGEARGSLMAAAERARHGELNGRFELERDRVHGLALKLKRAKLVERSEALLDILAAIIARYEAEKRARSLLDFDDLIERAGALFRDRTQGMWVRYKLDAAILHILVDESQDTNEEQWEVVKLLADEFFSGTGAVTRPRTVFAVGDGKQSIYSFQGANPRLFGETGRAFAEQAGYVEERFLTTRLSTSFRTLPNILAAVDNVFSDPVRQDAVLATEPVLHFTARAEPGGTVTLWPPLQVTDEPFASDDWPLEPLDRLQSAPRQVATRIAREIRGWLESGRPLGPRGRAVRPEDILILVQTRAALFHEIIRALLGEGVPTPGADRLFVTTHIAVLDLMALGDVLLNTADDLQLAALLRSPLFDVTEDELFAIANGRSGPLWSALRDSPLPNAMEAYKRLSTWRSRLDFDRPYEFYAGLLYAEGGLRRFHSRFGPEVDDLFAEFLDLALEHENTGNPSLQGFLAEMRSREVTITRELGTSTHGVRVMTVHGAKGLEAPIVILADAATKPQGRQLVKPVLIDDKRGLFVHASGKADHVPGTLALRDAAEAAQWQEFWRKLYVGMTRAEDELYVTGALTPGKSAESQLKGSWYEAIETSLRPESEVVTNAEGVETALIYPRERPQPAPVRDTRLVPTAGGAPLVLAPLPGKKARPVVRPSSAFEPTDADRVLATAAEAVVDAETARREGIALHALLQHLGKLDRGLWDEVAGKALAALLPEAPDSNARLAAKAIAILASPAHAEIFGPDSRAEVPFLVHAFRKGEPVTLAGRIDRLVVTPARDRVLIVDFKSDANPAVDAASTPAPYATQLGLYALVAKQLFPGAEVRAGILWTSLESLLFLPGHALAQAASAFTMR
jgi:ATP-dependent helicase/nuclease subunit A